MATVAMIINRRKCHTSEYVDLKLFKKKKFKLVDNFQKTNIKIQNKKLKKNPKKPTKKNQL